MDLQTLQKLIRMGIAGLASVCLVLDCVHIHQIRCAWENVRFLPYQYMVFANKNQLEVYYVVFLLLSDILAVLMYAILIIGIRPCIDMLYHAINRVLWAIILCLLGWWYPITEIMSIQRHANLLQDLYGCDAKTPSSASEYFCFSGYPNDYGLVYGAVFNYWDTQNADAAQWNYQWLDGHTVTCGIYRARHFLWLVLIVPFILVELAFGHLSGELAQG